ncbi:9505_t:CDS:10 [Entrophospora sp. SA101]|nr:9505_t:CDS:10 [Entrophospora sp. SA101]
MSITSRTTVEALPSVISHSTTFNNNNNSFFSPAKLNNSGSGVGKNNYNQRHYSSMKDEKIELSSRRRSLGGFYIVRMGFKLFCGDLGNEVTDDMLYKAFSKYSSIQKAKVIRDKRTGKSKGYGFVSFKDADEFVKAWKEMNEILGEGTYGVVYRGKEIATGKVVALKQIRLDDEVEGIPSTSLREISLLKEANIVSQERKMLLVFEYLTKDLKKYIKEHRSVKAEIDKRTIKKFMYQLINGTLYLHTCRIFHRDLKPHNLLISADGNLKIADFGLARATSVPVKPFTHEVITLYYRAPEILLGSSYYAYQVDIWSIGCIFAEMSNLFPLFPGDSEIDQLYRIFSILGTPNKIIWPEVICFQDYQTEFPQWNPQPLNKYVPKMDIHAIDLLHINPY